MHACAHVGVSCIICFAQEGAAKQTRTSICLGKPGFRDRPTNPCVLQVSDKTRRRTFGDPGRSAKPWIISRLSFLGLCAGKAVSQHSPWQKIQGREINKWGRDWKKKQAVLGRPAGLLDCTPSPWGDSVDADLLRLARLSVASKSLSKFHFLNYYFGASFT